MTNLFNNLSTEDVQFLEELAKKLKSQPNYATAKPLIYTIREEIPVAGFGWEYTDELCLVDDEGTIYTSTEEVVECLLEDLAENEEQTLQSIANAYGLEVDETNFESLFELIEKLGQEWKLTYWKPQKRFSGEFLTEEAAENHLQANRHHYHSTARVYCKHAWRNPELEQLLSIVEKLAE